MRYDNGEGMTCSHLDEHLQRDTLALRSFIDAARQWVSDVESGRRPYSAGEERKQLIWGQHELAAGHKLAHEVRMFEKRGLLEYRDSHRLAVAQLADLLDGWKTPVRAQRRQAA